MKNKSIVLGLMLSTVLGLGFVSPVLADDISCPVDTRLEDGVCVGVPRQGGRSSCIPVVVSAEYPGGVFCPNPQARDRYVAQLIAQVLNLIEQIKAKIASGDLS